MPPFANEEVPWWQREIVRSSDLVVFIVDLSHDNFWDEFVNIKNYLQSQNIYLKSDILQKEDEHEELEGPVLKKTIICGNKIDTPGGEQRCEVLKNKLGQAWTLILVSIQQGRNLNEFKKYIFENLGIIRVYTKQPGQPADLNNPLILPQGARVIDAAEKLHKDFSRKLKYARIWGSAKFDGQRVPRDYILQDKDIIEFHI